MSRLPRSALTSLVLCSVLGAHAGPALASDPVDLRIQVLGRRIQDRPSDKQLYARRAALLCEQGNMAAAEADLAEVRRIDANWAELDLVRARCMLRNGQLEAALANITSFRRREPDSMEGLRVEAETLFRLGHWAEAEKRYVRYVSLTERPDPVDYLNASEAIQRQGPERLEQASQVLEWGLAKLGNVLELREQSVHLALARGDAVGALQRIEEGLTSTRKGPRHEEHLLSLRGEVLRILNRVDEARAAFRASLAAIDRLPASRRSEPQMVKLRARAEAALADLAR